MGRGKQREEEAARPSEHKEEDNEAVQLCGICGEDFEPATEPEGYIVVKCNTCGTAALHRECAITFLEARASEKSNSHAVSKYKIKCRKRPQEVFGLGMPCPNGAYTLRANLTTSGCQHGVVMVGGVRYKNSRALTGACSGFTTDAEVIKVAKAPAPAPPPPQAPAPAPKKPKPAPAPASAAPQPKRGAGVRVVGHAHAPWTPVGGPATHKAAVGQGRGAGAAARIFGSGNSGKGPGPGGGSSIPGMDQAAPGGLSFPPGKRPLELQLCQDWEDMGDCYTYSCAREQLRERERAWVARQEAEKREAGRRQALAEAEARRRWEEEQVEAARRASLASAHAGASARPPSPAGLRLTDGSLSLLRMRKKAQCLAQLLDMDFRFDQANAATSAAGGDAARAVQMLLDGSPLAGEPPVDVGREAAELASLALAVGASPAALELLLHERGGNWEATMEVLRSKSGAASGQAGSDHTGEPDTPSQRSAQGVPAWAADASSAALSAPSPGAQSPRASSAALAPCALAPSPEPGVYSLADFSADAPATAEPQPWLSAPPAHASSAPFGSPLAAPGPHSFGDGYAAGLAAGLAGSLSPAPAAASPSPTPSASSADPWARLQAQAMQAAVAAGYGGYGATPEPAAQQAIIAPSCQQAEDDEVEALLGLMGIA